MFDFGGQIDLITARALLMVTKAILCLGKYQASEVISFSGQISHTVYEWDS